jgi:hypothetical protein
MHMLRRFTGKATSRGFLDEDLRVIGVERASRSFENATGANTSNAHARYGE